VTFGMRLVKSSHNFCMTHRIVNSIVNSSCVKVRRLYEIRMCGFWVGSDSKVFLSNFVKTGHLFKKLKQGHIHTDNILQSYFLRMGETITRD
jgi:hypothetical protein